MVCGKGVSVGVMVGGTDVAGTGVVVGETDVAGTGAVVRGTDVADTGEFAGIGVRAVGAVVQAARTTTVKKTDTWRIRYSLSFAIDFHNIHF